MAMRETVFIFQGFSYCISFLRFTMGLGLVYCLFIILLENMIDTLDLFYCVCENTLRFAYSLGWT